MGNRPASGPPRYGWLPVAAALLLTASGTAHGAEPGTGELVATGPLRIDGVTTWTAEDGLVYLEEDTRAVVPLDIGRAAGLIHLWTWNGTRVDTPLAEIRSDPQFTERAESIATVRSLALETDQGSAISIQSRDQTTAVGHDMSALRAREAHVSADPLYRFREAHDPAIFYAYQLEDVLATQSPGATHFSFKGDVRIVLWNVTLRVDTDDGPRIYRAGEWREPIVREGGPAATSTKQIVWIDLTKAELGLAWPGRALLVADDPLLAVHGSVAFDNATGRLQGEGFSGRAAQEPVKVTGTIQVRSNAANDATTTPLPNHNAVLPYDQAGWRINGALTTATIGGLPLVIAPAEALNAAALAAGTGGVLAALAAGRALLPFVIGRLGGATLFENPTRARLYDTLRAEPGLGAGELASRIGVSTSTAIYHLKILRANGQVSLLRDGKHHRYFENHGKWDGQQGLVTLLTNPKAALLASTVARNPGINQASLSEITGLAQSTVSFHLLRLHHCGALRSERTQGAPMKTYHPTETLQATLARLHEASQGPSHAAVGTSS